MNKVSVIIPVFNRPFSLINTLESVVKQTHRIHEIIVVDDGSSVALAAQLPTELLSSVNILRLPHNVGAGEARNIGARNASGDLLAFLDSDDVWRPEKIEKQISLYEKSKLAPSMIYSSLIVTKRDGVKIKEASCRGNILHDLLQNGNVVGGFSSVLISRSAYLKIGGIDSHLRSREDYELYLRMSIAGMTVDYVSEPQVEKNSIGSDRISEDDKARIMGTLGVYRKHRNLFEESGRNRAYTDLIGVSQRLHKIGHYRFANRVAVYAMKKYPTAIFACFAKTKEYIKLYVDRWK